MFMLSGGQTCNCMLFAVAYYLSHLRTYDSLGQVE